MPLLQPMRRMSRYLPDGSRRPPLDAANETGVRDLDHPDELEIGAGRRSGLARRMCLRASKSRPALGFPKRSVIGGRTVAVHDCTLASLSSLDFQSMSRFGPRHALPIAWS